ncbi:MAG: hypothetical protein ABS949_10225 [Solibacillus sp.]
MDISNINSLMNSLLGPGASTNSLSASSTNFADYFLNATSNSDKQKEKSNSLFHDLSSFGTSSALQGLLGGQTDSTSAIYSYLNSTTSADKTTTDTFSNHLQSHFQSQQLNIMSAAKDKLTAQMTKFEQALDAPNVTATQRLEQMKQNIATVEKYLADKQSEQALKNNLMGQLQSSSAYTQYLLSQQKTIL